MTIDRSPKANITRTDIQKLLDLFYARVRADETIGPIFHHHIGRDDAEWSTHLAKIEDFWANVMLRDRAYRGNPMQTHMTMPEIKPEHFDIWLNLFERTAHEVLSPDKARLFDLMARRIGQSLVMGIQRAHSDQIPNLG